MERLHVGFLLLWSLRTVGSLNSTVLTVISHDDIRHEYHVQTSETPVNWSHANTLCGEAFEGGHLALLSELSVIDKAMQAIMETFTTSNMAWIGAKCVYQDEFRWLNSSKPDSISLTKNNSNCVTYDISEGAYTSVSCAGRSESGLCAVPIENCPRNETDWVVTNNRCIYLFQKSETTWYEARNACLASGGDLVTGKDLINDTLLNYTLGYKPGLARVGARRHLWKWSTVGGLDTDVVYTYWSVDRTSDDARDECLYTKKNGWMGKPCRDTLHSFICEEGTPTFYPATSADPDTDNGPRDDRTKVMYIIGGLCGGVLVLVIVVVVLVVCLRKEKRKFPESTKEYESREFQFIGVGGSSTSRTYGNNSVDTSGYSETARGEYKTQNTNPYASSSIDEVIHRQGRSAGDKPTSDAGRALRGIKKRLSWLMKRDPSRPISTLPSSPTTPKAPDVVPEGNTFINESFDQHEQVAISASGYLSPKNGGANVSRRGYENVEFGSQDQNPVAVSADVLDNPYDQPVAVSASAFVKVIGEDGDGM